jgi:glycosyltransferase involved in cell wall biosynthesis
VKPLRLVMVARRFWPLSGAAEQTLARLAAGLAERQCRSTILTARWHPRWPAEICWHGLPVVRLPGPPEGRWQTWRYARAVARWLRQHRDQFDLVYVWRLEHEAAAAVRALRPKRSGGDHADQRDPQAGTPSLPDGVRPVVLRAQRSGRHGDCFRQIDSGCGRKIKDVCMRAAALVASTPVIRRELEAAGYPRRRIHEIPLGAAVLPPRTAEVQAAARGLLAEANAALRLAPWETLAVSTVRLVAGRGWEHLIAAWPAVIRRWPHARLWLAGEAPDLAAARQQIESLGLSGRILVAGVFDDLDALLGAADLAVVPAIEGAPLALVEAMAAGLPTVATDVPEHRHLAGDGQEALLVPPADAAALAAAVSRLLGDPALAAKLVRAAKARATRDFPLATMVQEHLSLFERLT